MNLQTHVVDSPPKSIEILYKDQHIVIVDKPAHLLVHPYKKECTDRVTLLSLVRDQLNQYLYPVHRIDRPVSGLVALGLTKSGAKLLFDQWHAQDTIKEYRALVRGIVDEPGVYDFQLNNENKVPQDAQTRFWPIDGNEHFTFLKVQIKTGRRHQIRRHFAHARHALIGDTKYGKGGVNQLFRQKYQLNRIFLHAYQIQIYYPPIEDYLLIRCPLAQELQNTLNLLNFIES